jgi:WD40 repeat protein
MRRRLTVGRRVDRLRAVLIAVTLTACAAPAVPVVTPAPPGSPAPTPTAITIVVTPRPLESGDVTIIPQTPDGAIRAGEGRAVIHLVNARRLAELRSIEVSGVALTVAEFAPGELDIAAFGADKVIRLVDLHSGIVMSQSAPLPDEGFALAWSPDGTRLASVSGGALQLWDAAINLLSTTDIDARPGQRVSWSTDGQHIAVAGPPSTSFQIFGADGSMIKAVDAGHEVWAIAYASNGMLAVSDSAPAVTVYDPGNMQQITRLTTTGIARDIAFSPDSALMAACMAGGRFDIWRTSDWQQVMWNTAHSPGCIDGTFSATGELYISIGEDMRLLAWNPLTGAQIGTVALGEQPWWVSFSHDNAVIAVAGASGRIHIVGIP